MTPVNFSVVAYGSLEYLEAVKLRDEILRKPLGLHLTADDLQSEANDTFIVAQQGENVVGCLILTFSEGEVRMRQLAVAQELQGAGIGTGLVFLAEQVASEKGAHKMVLHAREQARGFYGRMGYSVAGEPFVEVGVPHRFMFKNLVP